MQSGGSMARFYAVPVLLLFVPIYCHRLPNPSSSGELGRSGGLSVELDSSGDHEDHPALGYGYLPTPNVAYNIDDPLVFPQAPPVSHLHVLEPTETGLRPDSIFINTNTQNQLKKLRKEKSKWPSKERLVELVPLRKKTKLNKALAYILPKTDSKKRIQHLSSELDDLVPDESWSDDPEQNYSNDFGAPDSSSSESLSDEHTAHDSKFDTLAHQSHSDNNKYVKDLTPNVNIKSEMRNILAYLKKHRSRKLNQLIHKLSLDSEEDPDYNFHYVVHKKIRPSKHRVNHPSHRQIYNHIHGNKHGPDNHHHIAIDYTDNKHLNSEEEQAESQRKEEVQDHDSHGLLKSLLEVTKDNEPSNDLLSDIQPKLENLLEIIHNHKNQKFNNDDDQEFPNAPHIHRIKDTNNNEFIIYENPNHHIKIKEKQTNAKHIPNENEQEDLHQSHILISEPDGSPHNTIENNSNPNFTIEDSKHHQIEEINPVTDESVSTVHKDHKHHHDVKDVDHIIHDLIDESIHHALTPDVHHGNIINDSNIVNIDEDNISDNMETIEEPQISQDPITYYIPGPDGNDDNIEDSISDSQSTSDEYSDESAKVSSKDVESQENSDSSSNDSALPSESYNSSNPDDIDEVININDIFHPPKPNQESLDFDDKSNEEFSDQEYSEEDNDIESAEINLDNVTKNDLRDCCKHKKQKGTHSQGCSEHKTYKLTFLFNR